MSRWIMMMYLAASLSLASGCAICCGPYDYDYPIFESRYQRMDPEHGRVGSIFSDPNASATGSQALTNSDVPSDSDKPRFEFEDEPTDESDDPNFELLDIEDEQDPTQNSFETETPIQTQRPQRIQRWR